MRMLIEVEAVKSCNPVGWVLTGISEIREWMAKMNHNYQIPVEKFLALPSWHRLSAALWTSQGWTVHLETGTDHRRMCKAVLREEGAAEKTFWEGGDSSFMDFFLQFSLAQENFSLCKVGWSSWWEVGVPVPKRMWLPVYHYSPSAHCESWQSLRLCTNR